MRNAFIIATREYLENVRTKGFWISIMVLPIILGVALVVPRMLDDKAIPVRHFVVIDQNGVLEPHLSARLDDNYHRQTIGTLQEYLRNHQIPEKKDEASQALIQWMELPAESRDEFNPGPYVASDAPDFEMPKPRFRMVQLGSLISGSISEDDEAILEKIRPYFNGEKVVMEDGSEAELFAALVVGSANHPESGAYRLESLQYWSVNPGEGSLKDLIGSTANRIARRIALEDLGIDPQVVEQSMEARVAMQEFDARKKAGEEQVNISDKIRQWAPSAFVYLLFICLMSVMQMLLNSTIEEKSNRLLEILISSVRPGEIMIGKLLGNGMAGLTLVAFWILLMAGFAYSRMDSNSEITQGVTQALESSNLLPAFFIYFLLGFLTYSGIFLMIGSVCQTVKDAQSYMGFLMLFLMVPLFTMMFIPRDPNGVLATTLSWIPIFTPFIMLNRLSGQPPMGEIIGTFFVSCVTIVIILNISARVFKNSIIASSGGQKKTNIGKGAK